jgi:tetratricopeptide (TPR) repeat protein
MNPISIAITVLLVAPAPKPDEGSLARTLIGQADVAQARGDDPTAVTHLRAAMQAARSAEAVAEEAAAAVRLMEITRAIGDLAMAEPLVARALALAPGGTAAEADGLRLLGAVSAAAGDRASAENSLRQAVEVGERALGPDHERLAPALCDLGMILVGNGRLPEAEARLRRCLSIDDASATVRPVERRGRQVLALEILASLAVARGEAAESEALMRRAVALSTLEPSLGPADVADALTGLANAVVDRGGTREAGRLARRALALYERVHDGRHAEVAEVLVVLAAVRAGAGEAEEAVALLRRAGRVAEQENARPVVKAAAAANLGALWMSQGRYQDAEPLLEQALELGEHAVGAGHPGLIRPVQMLADCYRLRGRFPEAGALYERALGLASRAYGVRSVAAMPSLSGLAAVEEQAGHRQRAETLHRDAVAIAEDVADARDPARIEALAGLAAFFERQGESGPAEHLYVKAVAAAEHVGASDPRRVAALRGLASLYAGQGRRAEASRIERALEEPTGIARATTSWVVPSAEHP